MYHPTDRITHTTSFVTPVVEHMLEREIAQWVHPMKDRSDDPSHHERTLLPRSYISLPGVVLNAYKLDDNYVVVVSRSEKRTGVKYISPADLEILICLLCTSN